MSAAPRGQEAMLDQLRRQIGAGFERVGWKVGHAIAEAGESLVIGALTSATRLADGATYAAGHAVALRAETELAVRLGADVGANDDDETIRSAITGVGVALELVDVSRPPSGLDAIVAANVFHRAFVLGSCDAALPARVDWPATLTIAGRRHDADEPYPHVPHALRAVAALLERSGERLRAGNHVLTGSVVHVPVAPGDDIVAEIVGLGRVRAEVSS
jgi:2-keto-4-pentenoate hydratase